MCVVSLLIPQFITQSVAQTAAARVGQLTVTQAWSRPTPPAATVGAVYFSISNMGSKADLLLAVSSPIAARVELHESRNVRGVLEMRELTSVPCPAGATVVSEPGGLHVMLIGLIRPLIAGTAFSLSLRFRDAGNLTLQIPVLNRE
jgi:copper(I)-binding protein